MYKCFNDILSKWPCGFCKGFSAQQCLLTMAEKCQKCLDRWGLNGLDFSKAFDCILHDLLIAKLAAYGFDYQSLRIIESFLPDINQQKLIMPLAVTLKIDMEIPKGQFCSLLFNIYICYIFFDIIKCDIASYAYNNIPYNFDFSLENVISNLKKLLTL